MKHRGGLLVRLTMILFAASFLWACEGDDGATGAAGPQGPQGDTGDPGPAGPPIDTSIQIGTGGALTADDIATLGKLQAEITGVTVSSPPVVEFTVLDKNGAPALGIDAGAVRFTFAKLVPGGDPAVNGGLAYWQSYIYTSEDPDQPTGPSVLPFAGRSGTESGGTLEELGNGQYSYTFALDVTNVTAPVAVPWEPSLTHRVGMEIRLGGGARRPMAPDNPVFDFVPDGGAGSGETKNIIDTDNCEGCHYEFAFHGGQRKTIEYCVTCHNRGHVDADSGNSLDMGHMVHSIHMGHDRPAGVDVEDFPLLALPYIIYRRFGTDDRTFDFSEVHFPRSQTYCESCHFASEDAPDGDNWNEKASAAACGGCHADGLVAENFDAVTGVAEYSFDHDAQPADAPIGVVEDGACGGCHLGVIESAGPPLKIHSMIVGDQRLREELGQDFVFDISGATNIAPGNTPVITFSVRRPDGTAYDIVNDPEFTSSNASLNLYVAWTADEIYNGDTLGATLGLRDRNRDISVPPDGIADLEDHGPGLPHRMDLAALQRDIAANPGWVNADGSYTVTYFTSLPANITGDPMISLGGHPAAINVASNKGVLPSERAAAKSFVFFPGATARQVAVATDSCQACHKYLSEHGNNRNGNVVMCLNCHTGDNVAAEDGVVEGWSFGRMIHSIHARSTTFWAGGFSGVHFPQNIANCDACHVEVNGNPTYILPRTVARSVSFADTDPTIWSDDIAMTPTAAVCGACHNDIPATAHFDSMGAQIGVPKSDILTVNGLPNGQESCAVCHGAGSEFDTSRYHNPGL